MAKEKKEQSTKTEKPTKNLSKVAKKPRVKKETMSDLVATMVTEAFNKSNNSQGITLTAIKNYMAKTFDLEMSKPTQTLIKKFIGKEFRLGRIEMTNDRSKNIDYTKRFVMVENNEELLKNKQ